MGALSPLFLHLIPPSLLQSSTNADSTSSEMWLSLTLAHSIMKPQCELSIQSPMARPEIYRWEDVDGGALTAFAQISSLLKLYDLHILHSGTLSPCMQCGINKSCELLGYLQWCCACCLFELCGAYFTHTASATRICKPILTAYSVHTAGVSS